MRVFCGVDPKTKEQLYDLHARRAMTCTLRAAVGKFRGSEYAAEIAASSAATSSTGKAAMVGRKQLGAAKYVTPSNLLSPTSHL